ncbi:hypothetical protein TrST_g7621 [Triparma strigata]|uniref:Carrier domain-containing protein n=1 Tax=Triparma strigata TaxID=1606541 RepID=A0A9W7ANM9_9STRA|nr:hypothetical protein TrST_g7621 [Triparma strigata]
MTNVHDIFDSICFVFGDRDAIAFATPRENVCFFEIQALSSSLAAQLLHRFRPQSGKAALLLDLDDDILLEAVSVLAASRLAIPFVPVAEGRHKVIAEDLRLRGFYHTLVAVVKGEGDEDEKCQAFYDAGVHKVLALSPHGYINNSMNVPSSLPPPNPSDDLYTMYTSGTTSGSPKAVVGSTRSTIERLRWFNTLFNEGEMGMTRVARKTNLAFVDGVNELLSALLFGCCLVEIQHWKEEGVRQLLEHDFDTITMLPSQLEQLLRIVEEGEAPGRRSNIKMILLSGEICPQAVASASCFGGEGGYFRKTKLINLYGQTETTGDVTYFCLRNEGKDWTEAEDGIVPAGKAWAPGVEVKIEEGEIVLPNTSDSCYFSNGFLGESSKPDVYKTGDEGFIKDGVLYVTGRVGASGKVNGKMVVAAEVEFSLHRAGLPGAKVVVHKNAAFAFSTGSHMNETNALKEIRGKVPLHLAPRKIFALEEFPVSGPAGKLDVKRLRKTVDDWLLTKNIPGTTSISSPNNTFLNCATKQLGQDVDMSHSFVENGGDSMLAVTFLHSLKKLTSHTELNLMDILSSTNLNNLETIWKGDARAKRRKREVEEVTAAKFTPVVEDENDKGAWSVSFKACVDAGPVFVERGEQKLVICGCQKGLFLAIDVAAKTVFGMQNLPGAVEGGAVVEGNSVFVNSYDKKSARSWMSCFNLNLDKLKWRTQLDGALIRSSPVVNRNSSSVFVAGGDYVWSLQTETGSIEWISNIEEEAGIFAAPVIISSSKELLVFSSEKEAAWRLDLSNDGKVLGKVSDGMNPVFAGVLKSDENIYFADIYGKLSRWSNGCVETSTQMSYSPCFSNPCRFGKNAAVLLGCHDGIIRCYDYDLNLQFEYCIGAVIRSGCLVADGGKSVFVSTTAGDVLKLGAVVENSVCIGLREESRRLLEGEIWSDSCLCYDGSLAVGCRDSKLWFIKHQHH